MMSPIKLKNEFQELLTELESHSLTVSEIAKKFPKLKWCLVNNSIYDLKNFEHPGGNFIIEQINGIYFFNKFESYIFLRSRSRQIFLWSLCFRKY